MEEIACIYTFAQEKYIQIFRDIRWDVHQENPKFEYATGGFDLDCDCECFPPPLLRELHFPHYRDHKDNG